TLLGWIAEQQAILKERNTLVGQGPQSPRFSGEVGGSAAVLADRLLEAGRPAEALACIDAVLPAHEEAVRKEQDRVKTAAKEQQEAEPLKLKPGSPSSLRSILRKMPIVPDRSLHRDWARLLACRGAALSRVDQGPEAVKAVQQAVAIAAGIV